ncbi:MAG: D-glycero-beta-D-manno-heptose-7-phosphate kinase [Limnohabitans sp.]|nr:MAG: D-glycero-beta-D-manno-heptose-7-phosphate kinase [Limnohabitans sp.]
MSLALPSPAQIAGCRILVVGDVMLDRYWHGEVARISPEAPVPVVHVRREENRLGGAANVALNIKTLGARVTLLSMIGQDDAARSLRKLLESHGIESELGEDPGMETIVKLRVIGRSQQMLRIDFEKEPDHEVLAGMLDRFADLLSTHDAVLFSDYGKGGLAHIPQMIRMARETGKPVLIDPKGSDWARYSGASVITPNRAELAQVMGTWPNEEQLHLKAEALRRELGLQALLVTRSEEGMTLFEADRVNTVPAQAREVADVTGAGDTVIATLALMVACGLDLPQAMHWANRAGGLVVAKFGTASLTYEELCG